MKGMVINMAARLKDKDIDFYKAFYQKPEKSKTDGEKAFMTVFLIFLLALTGSVYGYLYYRTYTLNRSISAIQTFIESPDTAEQYSEAQDQQSQCMKLKNKDDALLKAKEAMKSYPMLTGSDFQKFSDCCGSAVTIRAVTYDSSAATLTFTATADTANLLPEYIQRLQNTNIFSDVSYTGYKINSDGKYDCAVTCTLKAGGQQ